jgi:CBS domain-containing protein
MRRGHLNRLLVVENGSRLLGIVSLQDLSRFLALKIELENGHRDPSLAGMSR